MRVLERSPRLMANHEMVLGITGHRPPKCGGYNDKTNLSSQIKYMLKKLVLEAQPASVVSGMALGVDQWAAEVALELGIKVIALIPCIQQDSKWPESSQRKYAQLLEQIAKAGGTIEYVTEIPYTPTCMQQRNQRIVDYSTQMIAIWDGSRGGTGSCVRLAKQASRPVIVVHPTSLEVSYE